jgi:ribosomal protein S18 acetylase RimI-like enzyme
MDVRGFKQADQDILVELWQRCGLLAPGNDPVMDIQRKLARDADLFLVGLVEGKIVASVMVGYEGHRGWINYLAVDPDQRGRGLGRLMMESAEERLADLGCPKINLQVRGNSNAVVDFYLSLGYEVEDRISLGKRLDQVESS